MLQAYNRMVVDMSKVIKMMYASVIAVVVMLLDQVSKFLILGALPHVGETIELLPFFNFILSFNYGISFSMFNNPSQNQVLLTLISSVVIMLFYGWLYHSKEKYIWIPIGLVVGGALGNMIDRVIYGAVIDFIDVKIMDWHYPTFNIADSFICIGVALLIFWPSEKLPTKKR